MALDEIEWIGLIHNEGLKLPSYCETSIFCRKRGFEGDAVKKIRYTLDGDKLNNDDSSNQNAIDLQLTAVYEALNNVVVSAGEITETLSYDPFNW